MFSLKIKRGEYDEKNISMHFVSNIVGFNVSNLHFCNKHN